jgi:molecular chaperone GrpE
MDEKKSVENLEPVENLEEKNVECKEISETLQSYEKQFELLKEELKLEQERAAYLAADFNNFRKRSEKDCKQMIELTQGKILLNIIEIVDDFERAFLEAQKKPELPELTKALSGFELIYKLLQKFLAQNEVLEIDPTIKVFNPDFHEAVMQVTDDSLQKQSGEIVNILQKGYLFKNKVLRPAKVSVKA